MVSFARKGVQHKEGQCSKHTHTWGRIGELDAVLQQGDEDAHIYKHSPGGSLVSLMLFCSREMGRGASSSGGGSAERKRRKSWWAPSASLSTCVCVCVFMGVCLCVQVCRQACVFAGALLRCSRAQPTVLSDGASGPLHEIQAWQAQPGWSNSSDELLKMQSPPPPVPTGPLVVIVIIFLLLLVMVLMSFS